MSAPDPEKHAALLCDWCVRASPGDQVLIDVALLGLPLARALYRALLKRQAWPLVRVAASEFAADYYRFATDAQLDAFAPLQLTEAEGDRKSVV